MSCVPDAFYSIMQGECTCPDFAGARAFGAAPRPQTEPCKHLAALLYKLVYLTDKDQEFVFYLRGVRPPPARATPVSAGSKRSISLIEGDNADDPICLSDGDGDDAITVD